MRETLGEHIFQHFLEAKREEWLDYITHVSPWEIERYLAVVLEDDRHLRSRGRPLERRALPRGHSCRRRVTAVREPLPTNARIPRPRLRHGR